MFCPNCGMDCQNANFCPGCGACLQELRGPAAAPAAYPPLNEPYLQTIQGKQIDLHKLLCMYGMGWRRTGAYSYLMGLGLTMAQAKEVLDPLYEAHQGEKVPFKESLLAQAALEADEAQARKEKIRQLEASGQAYCPKCLATSVAANKKGFGVGKAAVGAALAGGPGLLAGNIGAKKVRCTCLKCGHQWMAGKG